jgi:hypothetical protein
MIRLISLSIVLIASFGISRAQSRDTIGIEAIFDMKDVHKDGYDIGMYKAIDIPDNIARKCDKRKIRLTGIATVHKETGIDEAASKEAGYPVHIQTRVGTWTSVSLLTLQVWDSDKERWELLIDRIFE